MNKRKIPDSFIPIPEFSRSTCFGCGPDNKAGLRMHFYSDNQSVISATIVPEQYTGWQQVVHGGIVATLLDEIMGWTAIYLLKKVVLTKRITVDFLKPVMANQELLVQGELVEMTSEKHATVKGAVYNREDEICAEGHGSFRIFEIDEALQLGFLGKDILNELKEKFSRPS